jgi:hypothetical protein
MGDVKRVNLSSSLNGNIFRIPGTELCIFNCPGRRAIELWHVGRHCMFGDPFRASATVFDVAAGVDVPGKFTMAFLSKMPGMR